MKKLVAGLVAFGPLGLFLSALIDGIGVPVPGGVDVLIVYLAAQRPEGIVVLAMVAVLGSVIGNGVLFSIARKGGEMFLEKRSSSPRSRRFRAWFDHYGLLTVFISALVPLPIMPMKIFVLCSGALGASTFWFFVVFVSARIPRYLGLAWLGRSMGDDAVRYLRAHVWHLTAFAAVLFVVLWLMIRYVDRKREREKACVSSSL